MGCRILVGTESGSRTAREQACFFCSTTGVAFGPLMDGYDEAEAFMAWLERLPRERQAVDTRTGKRCTDPRQFGPMALMDLYAEFCREREAPALEPDAEPVDVSEAGVVD